MFTKKHDAIRAWLIDLQEGHCKNVAKKCAKCAWIYWYFLQNLTVLPIQSCLQKSTAQSEHDWSIYRRGIAEMLQKSVQKVLGSRCTFYKTWLYCRFGYVYKKVWRDPSMTDRFKGRALQKCCKKFAKSAGINLYFLQNLTVLSIRTCEWRELDKAFQRYCENKTLSFWTPFPLTKSAKTLQILVKSKKILKLCVD